mmetsp:Transcript_27394/g.36981  ORF Transcript_27394/g.36981 Transcript_27394/m.36981 type:complete len:225 (-) Transcript_27394:69-743(-)
MCQLAPSSMHKAAGHVHKLLGDGPSNTGHYIGRTVHSAGRQRTVVPVRLPTCSQLLQQFQQALEDVVHHLIDSPASLQYRLGNVAPSLESGKLDPVFHFFDLCESKSQLQDVMPHRQCEVQIDVRVGFQSLQVFRTQEFLGICLRKCLNTPRILLLQAMLVRLEKPRYRGRKRGQLNLARRLQELHLVVVAQHEQRVDVRLCHLAGTPTAGQQQVIEASKVFLR